MLHNLLVGFITYVGNKSALFGTQQIASATNVQVLHSNVDATAEVGEILNGLQATACVIGKRRKRRREQVTEGLAIATPYATAHLVEVRKSKVMGIVNNNGVGIRNVDTALDDGGGEKHIVIVIHEIEDNLLQLFGLHLPVTDAHTAIGDVALDECFQLQEVLDAVV